MRNISIRTQLPAAADIVWPAVLSPEAFVYVAKGIVRYPPAERHAGPWRVGDNLEGWIWLFGFVPFSVHHLRVESIDGSARTLVSEEGGGILRVWRHRISIEPISPTACIYQDYVEIDAGFLTYVVAGFAAMFYQYRQRRWLQLAGILAAAARNSSEGQAS